MPITGSNLNIFGNGGAYETDKSTWGYDLTTDGWGTMTRSASLAKDGIYSQKLEAGVDFAFGDFFVAKGKVAAWVVGKVYSLRAWVRTPSTDLLGPAACEFSFENSLFPFLSFESRKTITNATDTWVQVEGRFTASGASPLEVQLKLKQGVVSNHISIGGEVFVDTFEIYEWVEEVTPPPVVDAENVYWSKNPITKALTATAGWELQTNFRSFNDVRVEDTWGSGTYTSKLKIELTPATSGAVLFQVREAFRGVLRAVPPAFNLATIAKLTDRIKRFKHNTGEVNGTTAEPVSLTASNPQLVLLGGLSKFKWPTIGGTFFTTYLATNKMFMTWAPVVKTIDRTQEDYLNFFVYDNTIATLKVRIKAYFSDDTNETDVVLTQLDIEYRALYQIPAGASNSGVLLINPSKTVVKYELTLLNQSDVAVSETRTFLITVVKHPNTKYYMFLNSLGSFEVLRFTGQQATKESYSRDVVQKFLPHDYAAIDGEFASNNNVRIAQKNIGSGFIKDQLAAQWHDYLKDFLGSAQVYDVTDGSRYPVVITEGEHTSEDQNYERFIRATVREAYDNDSYTPATA